MLPGFCIAPDLFYDLHLQMFKESNKKKRNIMYSIGDDEMDKANGGLPIDPEIEPESPIYT